MVRYLECGARESSSLALPRLRAYFDVVGTFTTTTLQLRFHRDHQTSIKSTDQLRRFHYIVNHQVLIYPVWQSHGMWHAWDSNVECSRLATIHP
jgi:hypothetical protein